MALPPPVPPFDVAVTSRPADAARRCTVAPGSRHDCIGALATALGMEAADGLVIDGRVVGAGVALVDSGVANGSAVAPAPLVPVVVDGEALVEVACVAGPDCGPWVALANGRHVIGRSSSAQVCLDDHRVELHHALVEIDGDSIRLTQLTGQTPLRVDGEPVRDTRSVPLPTVITIGSSELHIRRTSTEDGEASRPAPGTGTIVESADDPWRRVVHRAPEPPAVASERRIAVPSAPANRRVPPATALIGAGVAVVGAGAIAVVMGQMMFALFAVFGAIASVVTWLVGAVSAWRSNRRERRLAAGDRVRFLDDLMSARRLAAEQERNRWPSLGDVFAVSHAIAAGRSSRSAVWCRRGAANRADGDASSRDRPTRFGVVVGRGTGRWSPEFDAELPGDLASEVEGATRLDDVPRIIEVGSGDVVTVAGDRRMRLSLLRSMVCQLAVTYGPADWQLVVVSADLVAWDWTSWLPHSIARGGRPTIIDPNDDDELATLAGGGTDPARATVLLVDDASRFAVRTGHLRRFVDRVAPLTLTGVDADAAIPAMTRRTVAVGATGCISVSSPGLMPADECRAVRMCGLSQHRADEVARALARLIDPEEDPRSVTRLPADVSLGDLDPVLADHPSADVDDALVSGELVSGDAAPSGAVAAVCRRWRSAGPDPAPRAAIGSSTDGVVEVDLVSDGPHALIAGTTGAGKSELLRTLVAGLALRHSPNHLTFVLVDYKGGSTFDRCADLPHTVGVVTDLDSGLAERALLSLDAELHRRERLLRAVGAADLEGYRQHADVVALPRLVVVIDEFAALAKELPDFLTALIGVAQRGRSLGLHLVLATQRPAGVVNDDIRANTNLRLALRLNDTVDAHDVVGDAAPAGFARDVPGRAALRLGPGELIAFQAARCSGAVRRRSVGLSVTRVDVGRSSEESDAEVTELDVAVGIARAAVDELGIAAPHRPWIDPLPARLTCAAVDLVAGAVDHGGVGMVDDPAGQRQRVLRWRRDGGSLALVGALGTGTTSTLRAVVAERCRRRSPHEEHWYVIDARGEPLLDELAELDHVGAVVRLHESERLHRVLERLVATIDARASRAAVGRCVSLAVDGLQSLRTALSSVDQAPTLALLERVLADGPAMGMMSCWTDAGPTSFRAAAAAETWVFRCDTAEAARVVGVTPIDSEHPGRLRVSSTGLEAQVAVDAGQLALSSQPEIGVTVGAPPAVRVLPAMVDHDEVPMPSGRRTDAGFDLDVGLAYADLEIAVLRVPAGDHIFIGGAASTGKTTALRHVVAMWQRAHATGRVISVDRRHALPSAVGADEATDRPTLIAVDDADRVDDSHGRLAAIIISGRSDITVVAAGRLEAVRGAYGHWVREVARSRCGLILTAVGDVDGDLLGATLPRRLPIAARPGLAWMVDGGGHRLVQIFGQPLEASPSSHRGPAPY